MTWSFSVVPAGAAIVAISPVIAMSARLQCRIEGAARLHRMAHRREIPQRPHSRIRAPGDRAAERRRSSPVVSGRQNLPPSLAGFGEDGTSRRT